MVPLAGQEFPIAYSSNAIFLLEEKTGMTLERFGFLLATGRAGLRLMQLFLWAGLEGGRLRAKTRRSIFTVEEVGDLVDETEGGPEAVWRDANDGTVIKEVDGVMQRVNEFEPVELHPVMKTIMEAYADAFPKARMDVPKLAPNPPEAVQPGTTS